MQKQYFWVSDVQVNTICIDLYEKMRFDGYKPDIIVSIMDGGFVPACKLSKLFCVPIVKVDAIKYDVKGNVVSNNVQIGRVPSSLRGYQNVLIVDDVVESGETMHKMKEKVSMGGRVKVKTCAMLENINIDWTKKANYVGLKKENDAWVLFSWEKKQL